jgi:hypothetical protein
MGCCGRPDNRANKGGAAGYYERYAYLSSHQRSKQVEVTGASQCTTCSAYTMGDPCAVCGNTKTATQGTEAKEG